MRELQTGTQLASRKVDNRPSLSLVEREGEPAGAVSLALSVPGGCEATSAVGALLSQRLSAASLPPSVEAHPGGLSVTLLLPDSTTAATIMAKLDGALRSPVTLHEVRDPNFFALARQLQVDLSGFEWLWEPKERCTLTDDTSPTGLSTAAERYRPITESARKLSVVRERAHFGLVGPHSIVAAAAEALVGLPAWPAGDAPSTPTLPPNRVIRHTTSETTRRLTLVFATASFGQALSAAEALRHPTAPLAGQLRAQPGRYRVEAVTALPRTEGGILRIELAETTNNEVAEPAELARVLGLVLDEVHRQIAPASHQDTSARHVLSQTDPRDAARLATWLSLSKEAASPRNRVVVTIASPPHRPPPDDLERILAQVGSPSSTAPMEQVVRVEPGQGGLLALLGSPCGTLDETATTAGTSAVLLHSLAQRYSGTDGVRLEAWTTPTGVGLLGHARVRPTDRTDMEVARRVGNVLGMVLATGVISATDTLSGRDILMNQTSPGPRPALWLALDGLSPGLPGTVVSTGTFASLALLQPSHIEQRRRELLRRPLRLAVLANTRAEQAAAVGTAASRWLAIHQDTNPTCPHVVTESARNEAIHLEGTRADPSDAAVTITAELRPVGPRDDAVAPWISWLLTRKGGWLDQALTDASLATHTEGVLVGGNARRGLVILVGCTPSSADNVVAQTVGLLQHLASAYRIDPSEYNLAARWFAQRRTERRLAPRHRLVEAWLSQPTALAAPPTIEELQRYLRGSLTAAAVTTVVRQPNP